MSRARQSSIRSRVRELIVLMICLAPVVSLFFLDWFWIRMTIPGWVFWKTQLVFLIAVEIVYVVALIATVFVTPVLSSLFLLRPRKGTSGPAVARGLLCSVCLLLSFGTAEAVWRGMAVPIPSNHCDAGWGSSAGARRRSIVAFPRPTREGRSADRFYRPAR